MADRFWTPEQDAALKAHVERNELPYSKIVGEINREFHTSYTRNAVIGRAKRIGCCNPVRKTKRKNQYTTERVHAAPIKSSDGRRQSLADGSFVSGSTLGLPDSSEGAAVIASVREPVAADVVPSKLRLLDLGPGDCRYPVDNRSPFLFCGQPVHSYDRDSVTLQSAYCEQHFWLTRRA
jgi:GcrA cell cycle regulator